MTMPNCNNCNSHVSERFAAVFATDGDPEACFDCRTKADCRAGAVTDPSVTAHTSDATKFIPRKHRTRAQEQGVGD